MVETIILAIVAASPAVVAIVGIITAVCKLMKSFNELKGEVVNTKEYADLKAQLLIAHQENRELKKKINELIVAITKIQQTQDSEE